ncbi:MAG: NAD(P)H-hydrate dehydratase, partial [Bacilli bacterium]|nr:NAD(P)H-hydrate dehydratase [Bacilli bacterium]
GMMGAPQLAAIAALQSGAGLVTLGINRKDLAYFTQFHPEIMVGFYDTFNDVEALLAKRDVVIFGPGLGKTNPLAHEILAKLIQTKIPLIVDADGLSYLKSFIDNEDFDDQIIITPHAGEMAKLMGCDRDEIEKTPWRQLDHLKNKKIVTVLKGATTIISGKDTCRFVDAGNPGMATAGSGDLLCGIIAAFLARGFVQEEAALRGVIWHCEAGRRARQKYGEDGITASRMLEMF